MGREWKASEITINDGGHKWKYSHVSDFGTHISVTFFCENNCRSSISLPVDPNKESCGLCATPKDPHEQHVVQMRREYTRKMSE